MDRCRFCGRQNQGNAGDHYHYHRCWQDDVSKRLQAATDQKEIARLKRELEQARYVGD